MLPVVISGAASAHDLWFVPETCAPAGTAAFEFHLGSSGTPEEARGIEPGKLARLEVLLPNGRATLPPVARVPLPATGDAVVVLDRTTSHADLDPEKFVHYLVEERHDDALRLRHALGEEDARGPTS